MLEIFPLGTHINCKIRQTQCTITTLSNNSECKLRQYSLICYHNGNNNLVSLPAELVSFCSTGTESDDTGVTLGMAPESVFAVVLVLSGTGVDRVVGVVLVTGDVDVGAV